MNAVKVDDASRIRLGVLKPGDYYEPDVVSPDEIHLRKVPTPATRERMTLAEALQAIENSGLRFTTGWDAVREETRG